MSPTPHDNTVSGEAIREGGAKPTPGPWAYRPQEHDDWGIVRTTVADANGWYPVVAVARYVGNPTDAELGEHRRNKTDPAEANARLIAASPELLAELLALVTAVTFADPPKLFNGVLCHEARVPVGFVAGARVAIAKAVQS